MTELGTGALVWAGFDGEQVPGPILDAIRAGKIGGLLLFAFRGNIRSKDQVRAMVREAQEAAERGDLPPVPIAVDQEDGSVVRVGYRAVFPSAMAIGAMRLTLRGPAMYPPSASRTSFTRSSMSSIASGREPRKSSRRTSRRSFSL